MKKRPAMLTALYLLFRQERQPHKLFGMIYLSPEQRAAILRELLYPCDQPGR